MKKPRRSVNILILLLLSLGAGSIIFSSDGQSRAISGAHSGPGKPVTIPLTVRLKETNSETEVQNIDLTISEDGEPQTIVSIRGLGTSSPITLALLIQDDLDPSIRSDMKTISEFVSSLPRGSRVMIAYLRTGSLQVKQKFTTDLEKAASSIRPPLGIVGSGPYNPYVEVLEALKRFDSQPLGRRAILLVSDGLDTSRGIDSSSPTQSIDLQRAISESQKRSVAVYGFFVPTIGSSRNSLLVGNAQSSLLKRSDETGGHAFFQGTGAPVSFQPFVKELNTLLDRQAAVTFLSTHLNKGFHKLDVKSSTPGVRVNFPAGYVR